MDKNALFLFDKAVEISFDLSLQSGNSIYPQSQWDFRRFSEISEMNDPKWPTLVKNQK